MTVITKRREKVYTELSAVRVPVTYGACYRNKGYIVLCLNSRAEKRRHRGYIGQA